MFFAFLDNKMAHLVTSVAEKYYDILENKSGKLFLVESSFLSYLYIVCCIIPSVIQSIWRCKLYENYRMHSPTHYIDPCIYFSL